MFSRVLCVGKRGARSWWTKQCQRLEIVSLIAREILSAAKFKSVRILRTVRRLLIRHEKQSLDSLNFVLSKIYYSLITEIYSFIKHNMTTNQPIRACQVTAEPSKVIKHFTTFITLSKVAIQLNLITMRGTILLVVNDMSLSSACDSPNSNMTKHDLVQALTNPSMVLDGLTLAIGDHSTCLTTRGDSHASAALASRLSKAVNKNRPVYVASNLRTGTDLDDISSQLHMKIFQFVRSSYETARLMECL